MRLSRPFQLSAIALALLVPKMSASAAVIYNGSGNTYLQNFDTLVSSGTASWANDSTLPGWYFSLSNGSAPATYQANSGNVLQNVAQSLGVAGVNSANDRALGSQNLNDANTTMRFGLQLSNATGLTLTGFTLQYTGEQWRAIGGENGADKLTFEYQIVAAGSGNLINSSTGWLPVPQLDFIAPIFGIGTSSPLDGNAAANRRVLSATVTGINWLAGTELWLRWSDHSPAENSNGSRRSAMAVDDLSISAVPEPGSALLALCGGTALLLRRRRGR